MRLETDRLIMRELTMEDYDALYKVLADSTIMQYYAQPFDEKMVRQWINGNIRRYSIFGFGLWAVCLKSTGEMIGDCGLSMQKINGVIKPEIGYHTGAEYQRKGYAKEASIAVRDWTFTNTPFNTIYSYMVSDNTPSINTALSYGCGKVDEYVDEDNRQVTVCAITREQWLKIKDR